MLLPPLWTRRCQCPPPPGSEKSDLIPLWASAILPSTPTRTPWLLTGLTLMALNAYFPRLSPVSSLWSPLQAAVPVLHWAASWWFVSPGWELKLVSLAPSLTYIVGNHPPNPHRVND
ncbi:hypothetical protein DSO57_1029571 [Entomophthora muscae]|uniref:Uncharacterized protein n=1 Tax=Entomophthora muscae TaxID=34485 RepID=A0ACC2ULZ0_9FUNG|nr:hypothetical protein DSO57_1029571 [Entomophthora muscae]